MTTLTAPEAREFTGLRFREVDTTEDLTMIEGLAVPYGVETNVGWYIEEMAPGVFGKSIRESKRDLPFLLFHNGQVFPIGSASKWTERSDGLLGQWRIDSDDPIAQEAARKARDGFLTGLSVGFQPTRSERIDRDDEPLLIRRIEARLLEVSLVSTPAYVDAGVSLVRSLEGDTLPAESRNARHPRRDRWQRELERLRAGA